MVSILNYYGTESVSTTSYLVIDTYTLLNPDHSLASISVNQVKALFKNALLEYIVVAVVAAAVLLVVVVVKVVVVVVVVVVVEVVEVVVAVAAAAVVVVVVEVAVHV
ncbi:hypothetical protein ElyMa_005430800 [Elysia marginata]|uniref:Uncharacterized protein n=1 Tax=Elysia marginata TaxID=1093978 RepID=A0AAV4EL53_9GAST|nr:hypothetical protein ElyMa_005430800 [Elysia marginata]